MQLYFRVAEQPGRVIRLESAVRGCAGGVVAVRSCGPRRRGSCTRGPPTGECACTCATQQSHSRAKQGPAQPRARLPPGAFAPPRLLSLSLGEGPSTVVLGLRGNAQSRMRAAGMPRSPAPGPCPPARRAAHSAPSPAALSSALLPSLGMPKGRSSRRRRRRRRRKRKVY